MEKKWDAVLLERNGEKEAEKDTRRLWEEIFTEDSEAFLDYYDKWKLTENGCYGIYAPEGGLASMLQMNPYELRVMGRRVESRYIIAVATKEKYRHRGLMRRLLKKSLSDMRSQKMPFVFLMPASEAIYHPFGFRFFYRMNTGMISCEGQKLMEGEAVSVRLAEKNDIPGLVTFSSGILEKNFDFYTERDSHYFEMLFAELESENGGILLVTEEKTGKMKAVIPFWGSDPVEIREILCSPEAGGQVMDAAGRYFGKPVRADGLSFPLDGIKPVIMGRIVDAEAFLGLFSADHPMEILLTLEDPFIEENTGTYLWQLTEKGSTAQKLSGPFEEKKLRIRMDAASLFEWLAGGKAAEGELKAVNICRAPYINEIV